VSGTRFRPSGICSAPNFTVFNPSGDNSTGCADFTVQPGETKTFSINNNPPPGGLARTIGFWKNWAYCANSNGSQKPMLDQTLAKAEPAGIVILVAAELKRFMGWDHPQAQ
jgi:hypothetical protein